MNPQMLFAIIMITAIILASAFGLHIMPLDPIHNVPPEYAAVGLYVCPIVDTGWGQFAQYLNMFLRPINIGFLFGLGLVFVIWLWALYQNFLKDKFEQKAFEKPWTYTKMLFWAFILFQLLLRTPDYYRSVSVNGMNDKVVMCQENTPGAIPVLSSNVKA